METKKAKRLPYGNSNFESVRTENYVYIDKTRFIELLENEDNHNLFFIRPRKFGKSLFFSMLSHYYDIGQADKFDQLFGDLYIGKHPTPKHNTYMVLNLDFSGLDTSSEEYF
ncbi:MAG: AAA family ATPase, partial [Prevotellaceae bacterium]|nr:AAA family ATPase [Prevotellaceae bacterium]